MEPIIKVKNLNVTYDKGLPLEMRALKEVSIDIYPEEFLIIFGPSGCGKSTLLYSISGIEEEIESGEIWYRDRNIRKMEKREFIMYHRQAIGMIFQGYQLIPTLNVLDNVALPLVFSGVPKIERKKRGMEILEHFGINALAKSLPNSLSGGQQQRIGIARALINNPEIILADEPTGNLDSVAATNALDTLKDLSKTMKKTVVLVTHEGQYFPYADRIIFMKNGEVVDETKQKTGNGNFKTQPGDIPLKKKDLSLHIAKTISFLGFTTPTEEYAHMEQTIKSFFEKKINKDELFKDLNTSVPEGGVGLYKQKAKRLTDEIIEVIELSEMICGAKDDEEKISNLKISYVTDWLLQVFHGHLSDSQKSKLISLVRERIRDKINHKEMEEKLDLAESEGGVGLNFHTARNISLRLEVVLA